ncbi:hypothetical protein RJ641_034701 [Dillenia turbinata]|uniref:Uncharacterized protein n=1 Tax=Dillenia turbinata TaxID=194707 RepID=A0AAN8ZDY0_9MAGN
MYVCIFHLLGETKKALIVVKINGLGWETKALKIGRFVQAPAPISPFPLHYGIPQIFPANAGKTEGIYHKLGQNRRNELEADLLKDMPLTAPRSCRKTQQQRTKICNRDLRRSAILAKVHSSNPEKRSSTIQFNSEAETKFQGYIEFYPTVFTVDARASASVSKLAQHLRRTSKTILQRVLRVYELCDDFDPNST